MKIPLSPETAAKASSRMLIGLDVAPAMGTGEGVGCTLEESLGPPACLCFYYASKWSYSRSRGHGKAASELACKLFRACSGSELLVLAFGLGTQEY